MSYDPKIRRYRVVSFHPTWGEGGSLPFPTYYDAVMARARKLAHSPEVHYTIEPVIEPVAEGLA